MADLVSYVFDGSVATIVMDDNKVNVMSLAMQHGIHAALDRAQSDRGSVVIGGRTDVFSAGFDLGVLQGGGPEAASMLLGGFELSERLLSFPNPVVMACTGHAIAMGLFLLLSGDYRVGAAGDYRITANEVAIGLTLPHAAVEILRQRVTPSYLGRVAILAEPISPSSAVEAGLLDQVVEPSQVIASAQSVAALTAALDFDAHAASKLRVRQETLNALRVAIEADRSDYLALFQ
jgi:enoyl-CoA hydratase